MRVDQFRVVSGVAVGGYLPVKFGIFPGYRFSALGTFPSLLTPYLCLEFATNTGLATLIIDKLFCDLSTIGKEQRGIGTGQLNQTLTNIA